jgi:alpha-glucuronidase
MKALAAICSRWALAALVIALQAQRASAETGYDLWLRYVPVADVTQRDDYRRALPRLLGRDVPIATAVRTDGTLVVGTPSSSRLVASLGLGERLAALGPEGYVVRSIRVGGHTATLVASPRDAGTLYGVFHLLRLVQMGASLRDLDVSERPRLERRLLDHWDNLDGTIERGYAGRSLWKWDELPDRIDPRVLDYARANASIGLNGAAINSVNARPESLRADYIAKAKALADAFRPYNLRVYLSANFAAPKLLGGLATADPADAHVAAWWKSKADEIYRAIPDFGGFLVKANSEGQPGPQDYGRTHADGANVLADAVAPHGGIVMWRAFVYDASVDPDRVKRAYVELVPLDGKFRENVFVQVKNGPLDFQPREPFHPLFGAMPKTPVMAELQITQEYLGQSTHLVWTSGSG